MSNHPRKSRPGFTLVEMAIVLLILGLALGMVLNLTGGMRDAQNRQLVRTQLNTLDTALANFVALNKRLPCPADGRVASGAANAGLESPFPPTGVCDFPNPNQQRYGVVPWVTLGISENDAADPWNGRITYRIDPALAGVAPLLMDMSDCDPAGTAATAGGTCVPRPPAPPPPCVGASCTSPSLFLANKGLDVWDGVSAWPARQNNRATGTGAAYVIISHGPSGTGAYNRNGIYQPGALIPNPPPPGATLPAGTDEIPNLNGRPLAVPLDQLTAYRDAQLNDIRTPAHFDDYLSHPTIMSVLNKANLGPRAH